MKANLIVFYTQSYNRPGLKVWKYLFTI